MSPGARRPLLARRATYLVGVPVLLALMGVLVVVVGPYVYIHFVEGPPPKELALESASRGTPPRAGAAGTVDGAWRVTAPSTAGYRVGETLFGQHATAVGRTDAVRGGFAISGATVRSGSVTVDLRTVSSDREQRDIRFRDHIMQTDRYPTATFTLAAPIALPHLSRDLDTIHATARGRLALHGTTRAVRIRVAARRDGNRIEVNGTIPVTFGRYRIPDPSFGPASVDDHGEIEFLLRFEPVP